jgi:acylphosphatase
VTGAMAKKRLAITVSGRVQGVGFRFFSRDVAEELGLTGWVRNAPHHKVELEAQGEEGTLAIFCDRLRQGPRLSHVEDVGMTEIPVQVNETSFDIFH